VTVLDVHPVGFDTAARVFGGDVAGGVGAAVEVLLTALDPCYGMAGTDDNAQHWAPPYDTGARTAITAFDDLATAAFGLAALLEQCAINYAGAEAACLPGQSATQSATRWARIHPTRHHPPPAAAGLALPEPEGWSLLAHLIARLWPNGHQDLLHTAADAWHTAATTLHNLRPVLDHAVRQVADQQHAPEIADAITVLTHYTTATAQLAQHCSHLANTCHDLAHALDQAHTTIAHQCLDFLNTTIAAETAGGLLAAATAGLAEAAAQAIVIRAGYTAATTIRHTIDTLTTLTTDIATNLDTLTTRLTTLSQDLEPTLARTTIQASVARPGIAGVTDVPATSTALTRLEHSIQVCPPAFTWANPTRLMQHFVDHAKDFGADTPSAYARMARDFLERSRLDGLPTKVDRAGVVRVYEPASNTFGVYNAQGRTITFFKPTSKSYWERQKGTLK
jgi:hypothetical protein